MVGIQRLLTDTDTAGVTMKRTTALRYADEIAARVRSVNGLLATPLANREAVRIKRVWVFGSTVKGSPAPNDLDLLIECVEVGRKRTWKQGKLDRQFLHSFRERRAIRATNEAYKWLSKGMKKVSRHCFEAERGIDLSPLVMIYPRNDLPGYLAAYSQ